MLNVFMVVTFEPSSSNKISVISKFVITQRLKFLC